MLSANGLTLGLNGREPSGAQGEGGPVVTFRPPASISEHPWGRVATFKDSEGNDIQLYEAPKN